MKRACRQARLYQQYNVDFMSFLCVFLSRSFTFFLTLLFSCSFPLSLSLEKEILKHTFRIRFIIIIFCFSLFFAQFTTHSSELFRRRRHKVKVIIEIDIFSLTLLTHTPTCPPHTHTHTRLYFQILLDWSRKKGVKVNPAYIAANTKQGMTCRWGEDGVKREEGLT